MNNKYDKKRIMMELILYLIIQIVFLICNLLIAIEVMPVRDNTIPFILFFCGIGLYSLIVKIKKGITFEKFTRIKYFLFAFVSLFTTILTCFSLFFEARIRSVLYVFLIIIIVINMVVVNEPRKE